MAETWGTIAKTETARRNCLYFEDVLADVKAKLTKKSASLIAVASAERLLLRHLALPPQEHRPFTVSWRGPLDALWRGLGSTGTPSDKEAVERALRAYYDSHLNHSDGQDGPDDADDDPAAACIYAAEAFVNGNLNSAYCAASRVVDDAFSRASDDREHQTTTTGGVVDFVNDCCHPLVQQELRWLLELAKLAQTTPLTDAIVAEARRRARAQPPGGR